MKKKIIAVTGIRSEYDILFPILDIIRYDNSFDLKVAVAGAHLSDWHGFTVQRIIEDGFEIADRIDNLLMTNRTTQRAKGVGLLINALSQTIEREKPDILLVVGDREESIATAVVGTYMDVLVAHVGGGDPVYGNADDPMRFAVSKLAHVHFTNSKSYANNLLKLGEEEFRVFFVGNPAYANIVREKHIGLGEISDYLKFDIAKHPYVVLIKHPLSSEYENSYIQMKITLNAIREFSDENGIYVIGIYPNTDPGSYDIIRIIQEDSSEKIRFFKSLPRNIFINIMRNARLLVGNSSMGILEAPFYKLPVVNVGSRQKGRLNAGNVEFVEYNHELIKNALFKACFNRAYRKMISALENPYGDETAPRKIGDVLKAIDVTEKKWHVKQKLC